MLNPQDPAAAAVAERWDQFARYLCLSLRQALGANVKTRRKGDVQATVKRLCRLCKDGTLTATVRVPGAAGPVTMTANLRAGRFTTGVLVDAPGQAPGVRAHQLVAAAGSTLPSPARPLRSHPRTRARPLRGVSAKSMVRTTWSAPWTRSGCRAIDRRAPGSDVLDENLAAVVAEAERSYDTCRAKGAAADARRPGERASRAVTTCPAAATRRHTDGGRPDRRVDRGLRLRGVTARRATINHMKEAGSTRTVTLTEPDFKGSYRVLERREDGTLVLQPQRERLSQVMAETDGRVFRDEEFVAHLARVAAADDDLPPDAGE